MKRNVEKIIVEETIKKAFESIEESPERGARNLLELARDVSNGRFQKRFFTQARKALDNGGSPYYDLVKDVVENVDHDVLTTFGLNLGYNGCTVGARLIREREARDRVNIPWAMHLVAHERIEDDILDLFSDIIHQGEQIGIHAYFIYCGKNIHRLSSLALDNNRSAFALFTKGEYVTNEVANTISASKNALLSVFYDENAKGACDLLRSHKLLYAMHLPYNDSYTIKDSFDKRMQEVAERFHPAFLFFCPRIDCSAKTKEVIHAKIIERRCAQVAPVIPFDVSEDQKAIDSIISNGQRSLWVDQNGTVRFPEGEQPPYLASEINLSKTTLYDALSIIETTQNEPMGTLQ